MVKPVPDLSASGPSGWDIAFTRMHREVQPYVDACMHDLMQRFKAMGLGGELQVRQTPRGQSTFLSLIGQRGLLFIVDITLIDGLAVSRRQGARLDIRLLDACGAIFAAGLAGWEDSEKTFHASSEQVIAAMALASTINSTCLMAICCFDVCQTVHQRDCP